MGKRPSPATCKRRLADCNLLATIHANSAAKALRRFANLVLRSHSQATFEDIEAEIREAVDYVVHVERQPGCRVIREFLEFNGYDRTTQAFQMEQVFQTGSQEIAGGKPC